jgi:N-carbamoyl-L-amino-acid hydrolase
VSAPVHLDGARLLGRLDELAAIGATTRGGVTREAWGEGDVAARDLVAGWMRDAGLDPFVDPAANLVGRSPGRVGRWVASGSHIDTVVDGGRLDGAYGVLAAIEVAASLHDAGHVMDHGYLVAAFANEEGARGTRGMTGSHACIGMAADTPVDETDDDGVTVAERIAAAGGDPTAIAAACWPLGEIDAFVELHIEQGPVLDEVGGAIGVVSGITGRQGLDLVISGAANHAGTTPMALRRDALAAAAEVILAIEAMPGPGRVRVATCGHIAASPNVRNVIPGRTALGIELRDQDAAILDAAMTDVDALLSRVAERRSVTIDAVWGQRVPPVASDPGIISAVRRVADAVGLPWTDLPSGAGHDAQVIGRALPIGMIFVPSIGGVSHSPRERTDPEHLVAGAEVLLRTLLDLDGRIP